MVINWWNDDIMTWNLQHFQPFYLQNWDLFHFIHLLLKTVISVARSHFLFAAVVIQVRLRWHWKCNFQLLTTLLELTELSVHGLSPGMENARWKIYQKWCPGCCRSKGSFLWIIPFFSQCFFRVKSTELDVCQNELKKIKYENGIAEAR